MRIVVLSPRVAPGILTLSAWDALREAAVVRASVDDPHVRAIVSSGIAVDITQDASVVRAGCRVDRPDG